MFLSTLFVFLRRANLEGYFIDEIINTEAAVHFFRDGNYTSSILSEPFSPYISTGLASTWPCAIGWFIGHSLLAGRISLIAVFVLHFLGLTYFFTRRMGFSRPICFLVANALLGFFPYFIPNWNGFIVNLGEISGMLWLLTGFYFLTGKNTRYQIFGPFFMGICVWLDKFIYLPCAATLCIAFAVAHAVDSKDRSFFLSWVQSSFWFIFWFFLPLFIWMTWIAIRFDINALLVWIKTFFHFIRFGQGGTEGSLKVTGNLHQRLHTLEWSTYDSEIKSKILRLTFAPAGVTPFMLPLLRRRVAAFSSFPIFAWVGSLVTLAFYAAWYFFWHPFMWLRHYQPGLLLGFTLLVTCAMLAVKEFETQLRVFRGVVLLAFIVVAFQEARSSWHLPLWENQSTYPRECRELFQTFPSICVPHS